MGQNTPKKRRVYGQITMGFEEIIAAFGPSALPAVAILFAVKMMLNFQAVQLKLDRDQHEKEIDKLIQAHSETSAGIIESLSNLRVTVLDTKYSHG